MSEFHCYYLNVMNCEDNEDSTFLSFSHKVNSINMKKTLSFSLFLMSSLPLPVEHCQTPMIEASGLAL